MSRSRFVSLFVDLAAVPAGADLPLERVYRDYRLRRVLGDVRSILNQLCYGPVWTGEPATFDAWRSTRVRPEPLVALASAGAAAGLPRLARAAADLTKVSGGITLRDACRVLSDALLDCGDAVARESPGTAPAEAGMSPDAWRREIGYPRKHVVEAFVGDARARPPAALRALLITGSSADGRVVDGFSDLDAVAVIGSPPAGDDDGDALLATVEWLLRSNAYHLAFNPCNHHGPMIALEPSLALAPEAALPDAIVRHGFWAYGDAPLVADRGTDCRFEHVATFAGFESFFERAITRAADVRSAFHAIWWTSNLLFLPLALHQLRHGRSVWKRDCLDDVTSVLPADLADVIRRAGDVRVRVGHWVAERLPPEPWRGDANVMPGVALAAYKQILAMTAADRAAVGIDDALIDAGRRVWEHAAAGALDAHRAAVESIDDRAVAASPFIAWPRELAERPRAVDAGAYDRARLEMIARVAAEPAAVALFEFGNVACPGLSDLDFLVVLDDACRGTPPALLLGDFPDAARAVIGHDALFVSRAAVPDLAAVFPIFAARLLCGRPIDLPLTTSFPPDVRAALYTWSTATKYPNDLIWLVKEPRTRWATILAYANSFAHVRRCLEDMNLPIPPSVEQCVALNAAVRQTFLAEGVTTTADLHAAAESALRASAGAIAALEQHWRSRLALNTLPPFDEASFAARVESSRASDPNAFPLLPPALRAIRGYCAEQTDAPSPPESDRDRAAIDARLAAHFGGHLAIRRRVVAAEAAAGRTVSRYVHEPLADGGPPWREAVTLRVE